MKSESSTSQNSINLTQKKSEEARIIEKEVLYLSSIYNFCFVHLGFYLDIVIRKYFQPIISITNH
jgi:hypothetical protein